MSSQKTYQSILGKFSDGIEVLKTLPLYTPNNPKLKIPFLESLFASAKDRNAEVVKSEQDLRNLRNKRRAISFQSKTSDINCIGNLIRNIANHLKAEHGKKDSAYLKVSSILKVISGSRSETEPEIKKPVEQPEGASANNPRSISEKTYKSLVQYGLDVHSILVNLGDKYMPSNQNISVKAFQARVDELAALNTEIALEEKNYSDLFRQRNEIYEGEWGINTITIAIKSFLSSLEGGRKNPGYIAFNIAVK